MDKAVKNATEFCFSAMAGAFPGAASTEMLWQLLATGETAKSRSMLPRWGLTRERIHSDKPGTKDRVYLHEAYCLEDTEDTPSLLEGRQLQIGHDVIGDLLAKLASQGKTPDLQRTALVVATSWSDESYFIASQGIQADARRGYTPDEQIVELARHAGLGGPALSVDTACSSFPYAVDMACALVNSGQADQVVVIALNALMPPALFLGFSQLTAFSPRARLQAFGQDADGIVPGECAVAFLVEPLALALRAERQPLGVLRAVGMSADGNEGSVFAPGRQAQYTAYQRAYAHLDPTTVSYVEAHGTGTPLGDATELGSLERFFATHRTASGKVPVGSIKSTIGHPLSAAGGASLAKALLMLQHRSLPPQVGYPANPKVADTCLQLAGHSLAPLAVQDAPLRVGISSFGFGGANAHLVVDEYQAGQPAAATAWVAPGVVKLDLAIVEAEAALAGGASLHAFKRQLQSVPARPVAFPVGRFVETDGHEPLRGHFLAEDRVIDIAGYGMGPKPLAHVDPFKLLVTDRVGQLVQRLPDLAGASGTAMVMCCNMGGERFTNAYSSAEEFFRHSDGTAPGIEVADVATMLPCMLSGYPAKVFDFKGFHQTLAGSAGLFWHTLLASPQWFDNGIDTLLLGAGRFMSGHLELQRANLRQQPLQGEGLGLVALRRHRPDSRDKPLLVLHSAVLGNGTGSLDEARQRAGAPQGGEVRVCNLQPGLRHADNDLHALTGFLAEASGIETLLAGLLQGPRHGVIEVRDGERVVLWLFTERLNEWADSGEPTTAKHPFTLRFDHPCQPTPRPHVQAAQPGRTTPARQPEPVNDIDLLALSDSLTNTVLASLALRTRAVQALYAARQPQVRPMTGEPLAVRTGWQRAPGNIVISDPQGNASSARARLRVDESHPYFFDHPLDHVPGILLIEGVLQLLEFADPALTSGMDYVQALNIKFHRYVMKESPVEIRLQRTTSGRFEARVLQDEQLMCVCQMTTATDHLPRMPAAPHTAAPCTAQAWLHKARPENVLVSAITPQASVETVRLPANHLFADGHPHHHSMVYFLEIARQSYMQIAHGAMGIPLKTPMNLLALNFSLNRAVPRDLPLTLSPASEFERPGQVFKTNRIAIELFAAGTPIGQATLTAQILSDLAQSA